MAREDCVPPTFDSVGLKDALGTLRRIISARSVKLTFQPIDIRRIDRTMAKHNVRSQGECPFYLFDHARNSVREVRLSQVGDLCRIVTEREEEGCVCGDKAPAYAQSAMAHNARKCVYPCAGRAV
jgi:hypothetical protein